MAAVTRGVLFDIDGTLVDTNYLHIQAWWQAFSESGLQVAAADIHRAVGKGSDRLVRDLIGRDDDTVTDRHSELYRPWLEHADRVVLPGAADLLRRLADSGLRVVLASSAPAAEADKLLAALGADDAIDQVVTSDDADSSKPAPDLVATALERAGLRGDDAAFVGDTVWDVRAAADAGVPVIGVRTGGISESELTGAGAVEVYRDVRELHERLDESLLGRLARAG